MKRLLVALAVAAAIGACTRVVVLSGPPDAGFTPDSPPPDAHTFPDAHTDGIPGPDSSFGDAAGLD